MLPPCANPSFKSVFENKPNSYRKRPHLHTYIGEIYQECSYNTCIPLISAIDLIKSVLKKTKPPKALWDKCTHTIGLIIIRQIKYIVHFLRPP